MQPPTARQAQPTCAPLQVVVLREVQHDPDQRLRLPGCCSCLSHPAIGVSTLCPAPQALKQLPQCALLLGVPAGTWQEWVKESGANAVIWNLWQEPVCSGAE